MDNPRYSAPEGASQMSTRRLNAGSFTEKAAATTEYLRQRAGSFMGKVDQADRGLHEAEQRLKESEKRLEMMLGQVESMVYKGQELANQARDWLAEHPEYQRPVQGLADLREQMSQRLEQPRQYAREHPLPSILAGGAVLGLVVVGATMAQRRNRYD